MDKPMSGRQRRAEERARPEPTLEWTVAEAAGVVPTGRGGKQGRERVSASRPSRTGITKERLAELAQEAGVQIEWARNGQGRILGTDATYTTYKLLYGRIQRYIRKGRP